MAEFILMGDTGSGYKEQYLVAKSLEQHLKKHSKIKSIMIVGDNISAS